MAAYDDLIPGAAPKRATGAYDDLLPGGTPAPAAAATAAVAPEQPAQAPTPGILERLKSAIFAAAPKPATILPADGVKVESPDVEAFQTDLERAIERQARTVRGRITQPGEPRAEQRPLVEPQRASVGPVEGPLTPMGGGTRAEALRAIPRIAGDTIAAQVAGLARIAGEAGSDFGVPGATALATRARAAARQIEQQQARDMGPFTELPSGERGGTPAEKLPGKIVDWFTAPANIANTAQQAPQLAGVAAALAGLSPGATLLTTMGLPVTGKAYDDYREKGYDAPVALLGALGQAATETVPEAAWVKFARGTRITDLAGFTKMAPEDQADVVRGLVKGYLKLGASELGQEEVSTIGNWLVDKAMQNPEATLESLGNDLKETMRQVALAAPVMAGAAHAGQAIAGRTSPLAQVPEMSALAQAVAAAAPKIEVAPVQAVAPAANEAPVEAPVQAEAPAVEAPAPAPAPSPEEQAVRTWLSEAYGYEDPADIPAERRGEIQDAFKVWQAEQLAKQAHPEFAEGQGQAQETPAPVAAEEPAGQQADLGPEPQAPKVEPLLRAIRRRGGIELREIRDLTGEQKAGKGRKGIPPGLFHGKGRTLDELANELRDDGFQIPDDPVDGGVGALRDMIRDEIDGVQKHYSTEHEQQLIEFENELGAYYEAKERGMDKAELEATTNDVQAAGLDPTHRNIVDADLVARASEVDEARVERAAQMHENDDAAFMAEVRAILDEQQNQKADRGRQEDRGAAQEAGPGFQLETHSEADVAARERAQAEAEARRAAEEKAAEAKRAADARRGDFILTGSDRTADHNPRQASVFGMPAEEPQRKKVLGIVEQATTRKRELKQAFSTYRTIDETEAKALKDGAGVSVAGYEHLVDEDAVRHILKEHGNAATEEKRGQVAVTKEDFAKLPLITDAREADVEAGEKTRDGQQTILYGRQLGDYYYVVEEVRTFRRRLALKTMWKTRAAPRATPEGGVAHTSGTSGAQSDDTLLPGEAEGKGPKNLGMPAATTIAPGAGIPPQSAGAQPKPPAAAASPKGGKARPDAIRAELARLFETVISEKHQGHRNLGIYRIKPETIRVKNPNDLRTIAHEIGHHISNKNKTFRRVMGLHDAELAAMMPEAYKQEVARGKKMPWKLQVEEGFAEFIAEYLTDRKVARTKAPAFFKDFESWLYTNPRYLAAMNQVADMIGQHQQLSAEDRILAKVGAYEPPLGRRIADALSRDTWQVFVHSVLDKWDPTRRMVAELAPGVEASKNPYVLARLLSGDAAIVEDWISDFTSPYDFAKRLDPKNFGKPLKAILEPVLGDEATAAKFKAYLIARRAAELKRAGKENLFDSKEIADGLALETPTFKQVASEVYAYNDRLVDYAVEGGFLSPDVAKAFKQYASYIPFFREPENEGGRAPGKGGPFKKLRGGTANIRDPIANLIQNTANIVYAVNRNAALRAHVELAAGTPGGGKWIETVPAPRQAIELSTERIVDQLRKQGLEIDQDAAKDLAAMQTFFTPTGKGDDRHRTIVYKDGGQLKAAQVNDPMMWKTLGNLPPLELGLIGKLLALPAQTLRAGVVLDPTFMARNAIRDTLTATAQSRGKFVPIVSTAQGIKMMAQHDDAYRLWRAFGGAMADQFREPEEAARAIERMARRGGFSAASIISPWRLLDALKKVGSFSESGSRIGEFAATAKAGDFNAALQAALNAREVSTDFSMRGASETVQVLGRIVPFMNPALQGLYKTGRVLSTQDGRELAGKAAAIGTAMGLASIALALHNADEDWYKRLEEWEKATYWHFKLGGEIWRLPKPFEYGAMFASAPEAIALLQQGKEEWADFRARMLQVLGQVLGFRLIPQAATIVAEPWANKSIFTGRKLVPDRQQHLEPGLQANPGTTKTAQLAGEAVNVSPAIIDNLVRNVFGTLGVHAATVSDLALEQAGVVPEGRERTWRQWPVIKAFVHDPDNPNSKQMRDFYDELEKYRQAVNTVREYKERRQEDRAAAYEADHRVEIDLAKRAEKTAKRLAGWRRDVARIERDPELSPAEKRERINEINRGAQAEAEGMQAEARATRLYSKVREASNSGAAARSQ